MHLQRLEVQGFKSFARKTIFEFAPNSIHDKNAKSITAVVGPNGSGKSNVADAIRWVLGEQSLKLIRCKKADDVIFSGSEKKARQGFAEVSLFMNNEDHELPIEYSEVALTRRVFRDGEAEYFLNKSRVRLFDILLLLAKANFGQKSYSIIGQGMVDHIINISPFERKEFFDEATGVKQYQIKRDQSVSRLRRSSENLEQTNQILAELEPRLRLLTRQIKKLEKRKEVETALRALQNRYYGCLWHDSQKEKKQVRERFDVKDALKQDLEARVANWQSELAKVAGEESRRDIFNNLQKGFSKLIAEKNELLKELAIVKGKMNLEYVKTGKQNLAWLEDKKEEIENRIAETKESFNNARVKLSQKQKILEEAERKNDETESQFMVLQNNLKAAEEELANIKNGTKLEAGASAVKAILRQKDFISGIFGTISDLGEVDARYETALSAAGRARLSAVVVRDVQTAIKGVNYLKENKLAPVTFLPLNKIYAPAMKAEAKKILLANGALGLAVDLLRFDLKFKKAFQFVFGDTVVVDTFENARLVGLGQARIVTLDGDILEKSGAIRAGFQGQESAGWNIGSSNKNLATQEEKFKEITLLKSRIEDIIRVKNNFSKEINQLKVEIQVLETKNKGIDNDWAVLQKERQKLTTEISEIKIAPEDEERYLKNLESKRTEIERQMAERESKIEAMRQKIDDFNLEEEKKKTHVFHLQNEAQQCQLKLNEVNREVNELNIALARLETKEEDLEKEIKQELGAETRLDKLEASEIVNRDQTWFEIGKMKKELDQIGGIDAEVAAEHKEASERFEFLSTQVQDLEKAIVDLEKVVKELDKIIDQQFFSSFKKINASFAKYFQKVFGGGKAKLELVQKAEADVGTGLDLSVVPSAGGQPNVGTVPAVDGVNLELSAVLSDGLSAESQNTGIEIMVAPPNKKIANIAVLSGGERTMTSLALICAIIDNNPSPFIVMDEVDAALDEANSEKFSAILQELSYKSQFIVITHNRVIMHVADALYGVAMADDGVSKTLSLSFKEAEEQLKKNLLAKK
ncbi:AAA family ATPase [Candidatus Falkowbacteria bacterium]|nr:AAA family ATPase [Candidatus Falkowbacteria bacterium]